MGERSRREGGSVLLHEVEYQASRLSLPMFDSEVGRAYREVAVEVQMVG